MLNEALARFEDTYVTVMDIGDCVAVRITIEDECRMGEVRLYG